MYIETSVMESAMDMIIESNTSKFKVYDKVTYHIDNGENVDDVLGRFQIIFDYLKLHKMLNGEGLEMYNLGKDESWVFHNRMLNNSGNKFMNKNCDKLLSLDIDEIKRFLKNYKE